MIQKVSTHRPVSFAMSRQKTFMFARDQTTHVARSPRGAEAQMRLSRLVKIWWVQKGGGRRERLAWVGAGMRAQHWRPSSH